jgi:hypothetical protein
MERGIRFSMVLDEGGMILQEPIGGAKGTYAMVGLGEKGCVDLKFIARSAGGHASTPERDTPLIRLGKFMAEVDRGRIFPAKLSPTVCAMFAEISKSGELVGFDYYKPCDGENFDESKCQYLAETFLQTLGYDDMTAVWMSKNGNLITFEYAYEDDGVVVYPDLVQIKVCCARGVVTGMDASAFLRHHKQRDGYNAKIGESEARDRLNDCLDVYASRLAIIPARGAEKLCYEFICGFDGSEYFVYVDAETGEETTIFLVEDSKQGKYIR